MATLRWIVVLSILGLSVAAVPGLAQDRSGTIDGRVLDAETGEPLAQANIVARRNGERWGASTDTTGRFRLMVPPGRYRIVTTVVGYVPDDDTLRVAANAAASLTVRLSPRSYSLNEVVVSGARAQDRDRSTTIQRVEPQSIERQDASDVSELAQLLPATHVATNSRGQTILYFRNAGDRQVGQFLDGALLNVPWDNRVNISLFPSSVVEEVTAAKGVVPVEYGTNVIGGAVNFQSRTLDRPGATTEMTGQLGSAAFRQATVTHLGRQGAWDYTVAGQYTERGNLPLPDEANLRFSQPGDERRVNTDRQLVSGFARASYRFDDGSQLAVTGMHFDAEQGVAPESHVDPAVTGVRYWRYPLWQKSVLIANGETTLGPQTALRGAVWGSRFAQDIFQYQTVDYDALDEVQEDRDLTGGMRLIGTHQMASGTLTLSLNGLTTRHEQTNRPFASGQAQPDSVTTYRQHIYSVGAEYAFDLTSRLTTTAGVSFDGTATPDTGPFPDRDPFSAVGLTAGLSYDLSDRYRLRLSGGRKGRFPTMRELFGAALGKFVPNPNLEPVTAWIGEVGLEARGTAASGSVTAFVNRVTDTIDKRTFQSGPNEGKEQRINLDGSRVYGVETTGRWQVTESLLFDGHLTWMIPRGLTDDGTQPLDEKPEWLGTGSVTYETPAGLSLMVQGRYTAGTETRNEQNRYVELPTSFVLDARVGASLGVWMPDLRGSELFVRVNNATDEARFLQLGLPGPGRSIRAGVKVSL
jgi:iron complex outermembrane receptor protein